MALTITQQQVDEALKRLDRELELRNDYINKRVTHIDSIRAAMYRSRGTRRELINVLHLADEYTSFNNDSAIFYYNHGFYKAQELKDDSLMTVFRLKRATYLPLAAFVQEAIRDFGNVDTTKLSPPLRELYYDSGRQMYSYIASFYMNYPLVYDDWANLSQEMQMKLIGMLDPSTPRYKLNQGEFYYQISQHTKAKAILQELLEQLPEDDNLYARAAHVLANVAKARGDTQENIYYLALSAIGDVKSATLEIMSLQELGSAVFMQDDISRAYNYLSTALANAVACHASMRTIQSSYALPYIQQAHAAEIANWRQRVYLVIIAMAVLVAGLVVVLFILRRQMRKMEGMQQSLKNANRVKEVYITQFLNLCSIYMDKLTQFSKTVNRKIQANKIDDLYKITKSGKFVEEQSKEFFDVFDNAFLHIYPTFVESVNALLRPDEQIELKEGELLNTDLRILAFMRLGIEESTRIAQILNYSVYTIYTYRNKLKNRAINRDNFESDVMSISSIS